MEEFPILKKSVLSIAGAVVLYLGVRFVLPLILPFVIAVVVSVLYYPALRRAFSEKDFWKGKKKKWMLTAAVVLFYAAFFLLLSFLCVYLCGQGKSILLNFPFYRARLLAMLEGSCGRLDRFFMVGDGVCYRRVTELFGTVWDSSVTGVVSGFTGFSVQLVDRMFQLLFGVIVTVIATVFVVQEYDGIREKLMCSSIGTNVCRVIRGSKATLRVYLKAQMVIFLLDTVLCTGVFLLLHHPYGLVLGPLTAGLDALPVLGAGLVLLPYGLYFLISGKWTTAGMLFLTYVGCTVIRQTVEPRLVGNRMGVSPLYTILGMYVGYRLFGVIGILMGPFVMLLGKEILWGTAYKMK